jgi:hypothetical protein
VDDLFTQKRPRKKFRAHVRAATNDKLHVLQLHAALQVTTVDLGASDHLLLTGGLSRLYLDRAGVASRLGSPRLHEVVSTVALALTISR